MTELIGELTELARGEEQQAALEEVRLDLVTEDAIRRAARNHPDIPIDADLAPTTVVGVPATPRARDREPARQRREVEPGGRATSRSARAAARSRSATTGPASPRTTSRTSSSASTARRRRGACPGSGLGLAIVRQVAETHGGTVVVEDAPDGGTLMRLKLGTPTVAEQAALDSVEA